MTVPAWVTKTLARSIMVINAVLKQGIRYGGSSSTKELFVQGEEAHFNRQHSLIAAAQAGRGKAARLSLLKQVLERLHAADHVIDDTRVEVSSEVGVQLSGEPVDLGKRLVGSLSL